MNDNLFKAILAMDAYNRGYDANIKFGNLSGTTSDDNLGIKIGNATIAANKGQADAQAIGFYALAYTYNGETVISYRGTDYPDDGTIIPKDKAASCLPAPSTSAFKTPRRATICRR